MRTSCGLNGLSRFRKGVVYLMPRDRKAIAARKRMQGKRAEEPNRYNEFGYNDPTAYQAIKNIIREASCTQTVEECEAAFLLAKGETARR